MSKYNAKFPPSNVVRRKDLIFNDLRFRQPGTSIVNTLNRCADDSREAARTAIWQVASMAVS